MMKNGASGVSKQIVSLLMTCVAKTKWMAVKSKTSALKSRIPVLSLLRNKKVLLHSMTEKILSNLGQRGGHREDEVADKLSRDAVILHDEVEWSPSRTHDRLDDDGIRNEEEDEKYPDLTHYLFEEEGEDVGVRSGSIIEMVKKGRGEEAEEFRLEDEIDHAADLFIMRFHKQMRMQKLESFKRYQEMLQRSV